MICRKSRIAAPDGLVTTPIRPGQLRNRPLALLVEQPFGGQSALQFLKTHPKVPDAGQPQLPDAELVLAAHFVDREVAERFDHRAVRNAEPRAGRGAAEIDGPDLRLRVLHRKVGVPGTVQRQRTDFTGHPERQQRALDDLANRMIYVRHTPDLRIFHLPVPSRQPNIPTSVPHSR